MRKFSLIILIFLYVSGCSFKSNLNKLTPLGRSQPAASVKNLSMIQFNSASTGYQTTINLGYKVKQTAGVILNKQYAKTPSGYSVYLGVSSQELAD